MFNCLFVLVLLKVRSGSTTYTAAAIITKLHLLIASLERMCTVCSKCHYVLQSKHVVCFAVLVINASVLRTDRTEMRRHFDLARLIVDQAVRLGYSESDYQAIQPDWKAINEFGAYRAIEVTHENCGTAGNDDWRAPREA